MAETNSTAYMDWPQSPFTPSTKLTAEAPSIRMFWRAGTKRADGRLDGRRLIFDTSF